MSDAPYLLYLHGINTPDHAKAWTDTLNEALPQAGYPDLTGVRVLAPHYGSLLRGENDDEEAELPARTVPKLAKAEARQARREFKYRTAALEQLAGRHTAGKAALWATLADNVALATPYFQEARTYLNDTGVRARVLSEIIGTLPESGRVVIVAHSLGSVIAADLLLRLPPALRVAGLVTFGSPLASSRFDVSDLRKSLRQPPANLGWWVNFWSSSDPVTSMRGVSSVFPWLLDLRVETLSRPAAAHSSAAYLASPAVAVSIGFGLFGSQSTQVVKASSAVEATPEFHQVVALLGLRYAHLIGNKLDDDSGRRYFGALRQVQATTIDLLKEQAAKQGTGLPGMVARLDVDLSDTSRPVPAPLPVPPIEADDAALLLVQLAGYNLLDPFEIDVDDDVRREAMEELTQELNLGPRFGAGVFDSLDRAGRALPGSSRRNWLKWGAIGGGVVVLGLATGGLAFAPAAGVSGAAMITSALAAFGPGGMIGGLVTAGSLVSVGAGSVAVGVMSASTTPESVEALVKSQLAVVMLREEHHLDQEPTVWLQLTEMERRLTREIQRVEEFSDPGSPYLLGLGKKLQSVRAALDYMIEHGLIPWEGAADTAEEAAQSALWRRTLTRRRTRGAD